MTCRELIGFLMEYLDGELPEAGRREFERHLAVCAACRAYLYNYQVTIRLEKAAFAATDEPVPADIPEELIQAIVAARGRPGPA